MYLCARAIDVACERSCICVLGESMLHLSTILIFDFGIVPTVWYFLLTFDHHIHIHVCVGES